MKVLLHINKLTQPGSLKYNRITEAEHIKTLISGLHVNEHL